MKERVGSLDLRQIENLSGTAFGASSSSESGFQLFVPPNGPHVYKSRFCGQWLACFEFTIGARVRFQAWEHFFHGLDFHIDSEKRIVHVLKTSWKISQNAPYYSSGSRPSLNSSLGATT